MQRTHSHVKTKFPLLSWKILTTGAKEIGEMAE